MSRELLPGWFPGMWLAEVVAVIAAIGPRNGIGLQLARNAFVRRQCSVAGLPPSISASKPISFTPR